MKKIILHIGSGKTGSTSIQKALFDGCSTNQFNFKYPILMGTGGNQIIKYAFCEPSAIPKKFLIKFPGKITPIEIQNKIKLDLSEQCLDTDTVVISCEYLSSSNELEVTKLHDFFSKLGFVEIHIIMYLRDPAKFYMSFVQQTIKRKCKIPSPEKFRYKPMSAINFWSKIKPRTFTVKEFNINKLYNHDVVRDFEKYLTDLGHKVELTSNLLNSSMTCELSQLFQDYHSSIASESLNQNIIFRKNAKMIINKNLIHSEGTKPTLKYSIEKYIHKKYHEELSEINSRFGIFTELLLKLQGYDRSEIPQVLPEIRHFKDLCNEFNTNIYNDMKQCLVIK